MIEPCDKLFPNLDAALASWPGVETESTFRGWLKNSISENCDIGKHIRQMIKDDAAWPLVYRVVAMQTGEICVSMHDECVSKVSHTVTGEYSFGSAKTEISVMALGSVHDLLVAFGVLVQIQQFIEVNIKNDNIRNDANVGCTDAKDDRTAQADADGTVQPNDLDENANPDENGQNADVQSDAQTEAKSLASVDPPQGADTTPDDVKMALDDVEPDPALGTNATGVDVTVEPPVEEPKPKAKKTTTRKKKVTSNEPSGDGGTAAAGDAETNGGENSNVLAKG